MNGEWGEKKCISSQNIFQHKSYLCSEKILSALVHNLHKGLYMDVNMDKKKQKTKVPLLIITISLNFIGEKNVDSSYNERGGQKVMRHNL